MEITLIIFIALALGAFIYAGYVRSKHSKRNPLNKGHKHNSASGQR